MIQLLCRLFVTVLLFLTASASSAIAEDGSAANANKSTTANPRLAYFRLSRVKTSCRDVLDAEIMRMRAESQLRQSVQTSLDRLAKAQNEKRPAEEIARLEQQCKDEVKAKQEALANLIEQNWQRVRSKISAAIAAVSNSKGLDVAVDLDGVFLGGEILQNSGVDITDEVISQLK